MHSAAHRGVTVVTILTLVFTPVWKGHHWVNELTGRSSETHVVQCQPNDPCPAKQKVTVTVVLPPQQP